MTTFEVELEQEKAEKIAAVASRAAGLAREFGQDPEDVAVFLRHYFRHVDAMDVDERRVEDLLGLVASHYRAALHRPAARAVISIRTPSQRDDGWTAGGATAVQIVTDDRPFLVDSVTMELLRQDWSIREVFHPQFLVRRDLDGELRGIVRSTEAAHDPAVTAESWMHLEILPPARPGRQRHADRRPGERLARSPPAGRRSRRGLAEDDHSRRGDHPAAQGPDAHGRPDRGGGPDPGVPGLAECQPLHLPRLSRVHAG